MTSLFHGSALCDVDPDGNVAIPDFVAEAIDAGTAELLLAKHDIDGCLIGYGREHLSDLHALAERRRLADEARGQDAREHHRRMRRTFGVVERMPRAGTALRIPAAMRHLGKIGALALFVGAGDSFEIWNPDLAIQHEDQQFRDLATFRIQARGDAPASPYGVN